MNSRQIVTRYVKGWLKGDLKIIIGTLSKDAVIVESDMSSYKGLEDIKKWIENWNFSGSKVDSWRIKSFYEAGNTFLFEWHFKCFVNKRVHEFDGISIGKIKEQQIYYLREYRTKT